MTETELEFVSPPVRAVELTLFFEPVELKLTDLAPLGANLREEFPQTTERFQLMPWQWENRPPDELPTLIEGGNFPFPYLTFSNDEGRSIAFQDDRLTLRWEFVEGRDYPGYDSLSGQLSARLSSFRMHVEAHANAELRVMRARAEYENLMPDYSAWTVARRAHQIEVAAAPSLTPGLVSANTGGSYRFRDNGKATKVEFAAVSKEDSETLSLRSTTRVEQEDSRLDPFEALGEAHSRLLDCFVMLTTQEQHEMWGMK